MGSYELPTEYFSVNGVACTIFVGADGDQGGITEQYDLAGGGAQATVILKCLWSERRTLIRGLLGTVSDDNGSIQRTTPYSYPVNQAEFAAGDAISGRWICTSVGQVTGIKWQTDFDGSATGTFAGWGGYVFALIPANFTVPLWQCDESGAGGILADPSQMPYVVTKYRVSGEVFAPPAGSFIYNGGSFEGQALADVSASQIRTRLEISCTRVRMPFVPLQTIQSLVGKVNQSPFTLNGEQLPMGAVLFTGINSDPKPDPCNFGVVQDVELTFLANAGTVTNGSDPLDWNYFMDPGGTFSPVVSDDTGEPVFGYSDFSILFSDTIT